LLYNFVEIPRGFPPHGPGDEQNISLFESVDYPDRDLPTRNAHLTGGMKSGQLYCSPRFNRKPIRNNVGGPSSGTGVRCTTYRLSKMFSTAM